MTPLDRLRQQRKAIQRRIDKLRGKRDNLRLIAVEGLTWFATSYSRATPPPTLDETVPDWRIASADARAFIAEELGL